MLEHAVDPFLAPQLLGKACAAYGPIERFKYTIAAFVRGSPPDVDQLLPRVPAEGQSLRKLCCRRHRRRASFPPVAFTCGACTGAAFRRLSLAVAELQQLELQHEVKRRAAGRSVRAPAGERVSRRRFPHERSLALRPHALPERLGGVSPIRIVCASL